MNKILTLLVIGLSIVSCKQQEKEKDVSNDEVVTEEVVEPTKPEETELYEPVPPTVNPIGQNGVPSDAILLFNGENLDAWVHTKGNRPPEWILNEDGSMTVKNKSGHIQTKQNFGSIQLHIEWSSPADIQGEKQSRGNSGVFLQGRYEVQVLDNNDNDTYVNGQVGSIYKQSIPLAKASVPSGEWNAYDIIFHEPEFADDATVTKKATITVLHNGVLIQDHFEILGPIKYIGLPKYEKHGKAPLMLQDHGDNSRVSYRNIWVREL